MAKMPEYITIDINSDEAKQIINDYLDEFTKEYTEYLLFMYSILDPGEFEELLRKYCG